MRGLSLLDVAFLGGLTPYDGGPATDDFDSYATDVDMADGTMNGGTNWSAAYVSTGTPPPATDKFDEYASGYDLNGLTLGSFWGGAYVSSGAPPPATDTFDSYAAAQNLNGLANGTFWDAAYVSS